MQILVMQQLVLLGATNNYQGEISDLAQQTVQALQYRYDYNTNYDRILGVLQQFSFNQGTPAFSCLSNDNLWPNVGQGLWPASAIAWDNVWTSNNCPSSPSQPSCTQTENTGGMLISSGCTTYQTYAAMNCQSWAWCTTLESYNTDIQKSDDDNKNSGSCPVSMSPDR